MSEEENATLKFSAKGKRYSQAEYRKARRDWCNEHSVCYNCYTPIEPGKNKTCFKCRVTASKHAEIKRNKLISQGRCVKCGYWPPKQGSVTCGYCLYDKQVRSERAKERRKQNE